MAMLGSITIDCGDADALARFWSQALDGYAIDTERPMVINSESGPLIYFQKVPEPKTVKNRVHLDLKAADRAAEVERLRALGASVFRELDEGGNRWTIMQDPEGNEFCVTPV